MSNAALTRSESSNGKVLITVRLKGRFDLPQALAIDYSRVNDAALSSSIGMLQQGLSGHYGDYPVLLDLPPGRYQLRSLRIAGQSRNANGTLLARLADNFDAIQSEARYIGRIVVFGGNDVTNAPYVSWEDHFEADTLLAKSMATGLKDKNFLDASRQPTIVPGGNRTPLERQVTIGPVGPSISYILSDSQLPLFRQFLSAPHPRAFATGDYGAAGFASGSDAVRRAMERCNRRGGSESCRVLAVDDTVVFLTPSSTNTIESN